MLVDSNIIVLVADILDNRSSEIRGSRSVPAKFNVCLAASHRSALCHIRVDVALSGSLKCYDGWVSVTFKSTTWCVNRKAML
jgi:hypothetical protein